MNLTWTTLDDVDPRSLRGLVEAALNADGGLPLVLEEGLLRARLSGDATTAVLDAGGGLVAAAAVRGTGPGVTTSGFVHPDARGHGLGRQLLGWAADYAGDRPLTVQTESSSPAAERLYERFGLRQVFAELVMRHDLELLHQVDAPVGIAIVPARHGNTSDLFAAYTSSFADRPGFTEPTQEEWLQDLEDDDQWDRDLSVVAYEGSTPVAFINVLGNWIDQVGVAPACRGRRIGAHLVTQTLQQLQAVGNDHAWLTVEIANPARALYASLGFSTYGKRARFA